MLLRLTQASQKEFMPMLERWGVWVPGYIGGYFRGVDAWKQVSYQITMKTSKLYSDSNMGLHSML